MSRVCLARGVALALLLAASSCAHVHAAGSEADGEGVSGLEEAPRDVAVLAADAAAAHGHGDGHVDGRGAGPHCHAGHCHAHGGVGSIAGAALIPEEKKHRWTAIVTTTLSGLTALLGARAARASRAC